MNSMAVSFRTTISKQPGHSAKPKSLIENPPLVHIGFSRPYGKRRAVCQRCLTPRVEGEAQFVHEVNVPSSSRTNTNTVRM